MKEIRIAKVGWAGMTRRAHADDMLSLLGVKRLPREGMGERLIEGVRVYVAPLVPGWGKRHTSTGRHWQGLRVMAICECGQHVAVGRMHQHKCKLEDPSVAANIADQRSHRNAKAGV